MGGPGRGSGLEAEQAGVGPGAGSPSEPTVLRDVELPEPRGEVMVGAAGAVRVSHTVPQSHTSPLGPHPRLGLGLERLSPWAPSGMAERPSRVLPGSLKPRPEAARLLRDPDAVPGEVRSPDSGA